MKKIKELKEIISSNKENIKKVIWVLSILITIFVVSYLLSFGFNNNKNQNNYSAQIEDMEKIIIEKDVVTREKYTCNKSANVWWTECIIEKLDRASAEREWKQHKLEQLKDSEVNIENMLPQLSDEQAKIRTWREEFEEARNAWCEAEHVFVSGSGTPGGIADCELEIELKAIHDLNVLYYDSLLDFNQSQGIKDFEPTKKDIEKLMKINKTKRGCVWADEENCDYTIF